MNPQPTPDGLLHVLDCPGGQPGEKRVAFWCPACECGHWVRIAGTDGVWSFNGNFDKPTLTPSVLVRGTDRAGNPTVCHCHVTDGHIQFCNDCTHDMASKTVPMEPM